MLPAALLTLCAAPQEGSRAYYHALLKDPLSTQAMPVPDLAALSSRLFSFGEVDLGMRVDIERWTRMYADEAPEATVRAALDNSSMALLTSGLDAHGISVARQALVGGEVGCDRACEPPQPVEHNGVAHGVRATDARRFIGCCIRARDTVQHLTVARGASVDVPNAYGYAPLHFAAAADQPQLVLDLIRRGANASAQTMFGLTPLHLAASRNATAAIGALMSTDGGRASVGVRDGAGGEEKDGQGGRTAIDLACRMGFKPAAAAIDPEHDCGKKGYALRGVIKEGIDCAFDVRTQEELTAGELVRDYLSIGKPVLIKGPLGAGDFFRADQWTRQRLQRRWGETRVRVEDIPSSAAFGVDGARSMSLGEYHAKVLDPRTGRGREIVMQSFPTDDPSSVAAGFVLRKGSVLDPDMTAIRPDRVLFSLGPRGAGAPMRYSRAAIDILVRGSRTWLALPPSEAMLSTMHPADATKTAPWPWPKEELYSCVQEAGDLMVMPDMWGRAMMNDEESLSFSIEIETGVNEFSIDV